MAPPTAGYRRCHILGTLGKRLGVMDGPMTLGTRLLTWLRGELVGTDSFGNRYYRREGLQAPAARRRPGQPRKALGHV